MARRNSLSGNPETRHTVGVRLPLFSVYSWGSYLSIAQCFAAIREGLTAGSFSFRLPGRLAALVPLLSRGTREDFPGAALQEIPQPPFGKGGL